MYAAGRKGNGLMTGKLKVDIGDSVVETRVLTEAQPGNIRQEAAMGLEEPERRLAEILDCLPDATFVINKQGEIILWNRAMEKMTGCTRDRMIGRGSYEYALSFYGERRPILIDLVSVPDRESERLVTDYDMVRWDGDTLQGEVFVPAIYGGQGAFLWGCASRLYNMQGRSIGAIQSVRDISERKCAELERDSLRHLTKTIIDSMPSILIAVDINECVVQWNLEAERRTGIPWEDAIGRRIGALLPASALHLINLESALTEGRVIQKHRVNLSDYGLPEISEVMIYPLTAGALTGAVVRIDDMTEHVRMEETIIQTEKMMSLGGLAAGMAHEINNPLSGITQAAQNIERRLVMDLENNRATATRLGLDPEAIKCYYEERKIGEFIQNIKFASARTSKIINNMLQFSRRSSGVKEVVELTALVDRTLDLAMNDYNHGRKYDFRHVIIEREYSPSLPPVYCTPCEIEQVVFNLLKNAANAMFDNPERDREPKIVLRVFQERRWTVIEVQDNGPGMDEKTKKRVFEPFFTTRALGSGTGLGLSVSYFIIHNNHNGELMVESSPGHGARFIIKLPPGMMTPGNTIKAFE